MRVFIQTLGCKVNQYESQALETMLTQRGHAVSMQPEGCDVLVVNTCAVTSESGRKSRQAIRRLQAQSPGAVMAVCGCYSQLSPEETSELGASVIFGSADREKFVEALERAAEARREQGEDTETMEVVDDAMRRRAFEELPAGNLHGRTRAMLKIQDGCSNFCSYCIIPYARGPVRSLPLHKAAESAAKLEKDGFREIVVTGIEIASYGRDLKDGSTLIDVLCAVADSAPRTRLRLGSLEPRIITEDFCRRLREKPNLCPHFHLSLQSGCDETLRRMRRKYDTALFSHSVSLLREYFPDCGLTADLIVGFPGETEEEFSQTLKFIKSCAFSKMHVFPYSKRPGTPAAVMEGQLTSAEKHDRALRAGAAADRMERAYLEGRIGTVQRVLFERERDGVSTGHAENYCEVAVHGGNLRNCICNVQITGVNGTTLLGNILS